MDPRTNPDPTLPRPPAPFGLKEEIDLQLRRKELHDQMRELDARKARREELAAMLLLKLVENTNGRGKYDMDVNVRAAVEYTDALLAELEKEK